MSDPILKVQGISKSFGALKASDNISLDLRVGEIHALIGPNGAGKSTLIQQVSGGIKSDEGSIHFSGSDVSFMSVDKRAKLGLARTFQISALPMEYTVLENVVLGLVGNGGHSFQFFTPIMNDKHMLKRARSVLERVELIDHANTATSSLSHGQRRQLEVAVALTLSPKALLMDEPMAGMGIDGSKRLTALLRELKKEAPILLVEHDMDAVFALADRISVLVYGKIIATGNADEIKSNPQVQLAYLGDAS